MNPVAAYRAAVRFARMKSSWLGDGGEPVSLAQAQTRAFVCFDCPLNKSHPIWEILAAPAIAIVTHQLALKDEMQLKVEREDKLHTCDGCMCILSLKVWVPLAHIRDTTPLESLATGCWIFREMTGAALKTTTP